MAHLEEDAIDVDAALESFWAEETEKAAAAAARGDARATNDLPLARIKRIMKSDEDVRMIAAEAPGASAAPRRAARAGAPSAPAERTLAGVVTRLAAHLAPARSPARSLSFVQCCLPRRASCSSRS